MPEPGLGLTVRRFGRRSHADGCVLQVAAARRVQGGADDELLFLEHDPVITRGRGARPEQLRVSPAELSRRGVTLTTCRRGGGATFHGPGQIIGYLIVDLRRRGLGVGAFVRAMERCLVGSLRAERIEAFCRPGLTGVWTHSGKIAAIGIAVQRGVTRHGFALNVDVDLEGFELIVPCGLSAAVTSMAAMGWSGNRGTVMARIAVEIGGGLAVAIPDRGRPLAAVAGMTRGLPATPAGLL